MCGISIDMLKSVTGWLVEGQTHTLILILNILMEKHNNNNYNKMTTDTHTEYTYTQREDHIEHKPNSCRANKNKA